MFKKLVKEGLILAGGAAAGVISGLLFINKNEIKEEKKNNRSIQYDSSEDISFEDLNEEIIKSNIIEIDDDDVEIDKN